MPPVQFQQGIRLTYFVQVVAIDIFSEMRPDDAPENVFFEASLSVNTRVEISRQQVKSTRKSVLTY